MLKEKLDDLSRQSICENLNISRATLNNWEKYKTENIFKYLKLCKMLNINPFDELDKYERLQELT
ncbi:helix-turn-helix transcriptional regulator, partial [Niameybacter massiliensis]